MKNNQKISLMLKTFRYTTLALMLGSTANLYAQPENINLVILGTSDMHANIWGFSYEDQKDTPNNGMARVATYIDTVRKEHPDLILIDNGDLIQGTILSDDIFNKQLDKPHPVIDVMNTLKYDAMTLGNHEFNFGLALIDKLVKEAQFPILAANVTNKQDGTDFVLPYTVLEREGVKIGIIGLTNPNVPRWDGEKVDSLDFAAIAQTAAKYAKKLKEENQADILVLSVHAGMVAEFDEENGSDAAEEVLKLVPEADVLLIGHTHTKFKETIGNTFIGEPRNSGRDVVRFDIALTKDWEKVSVLNKSVDVIDMEAYEPSQAIRELTQEAHQATLNFLKGEGANGLNGSGGKFGVALADFQPKDEIKGIPQGRLQDTAVVDLINKVQLLYSGADVSSAALFKDTSDIKAGNITYGNIFDIYKFDNTLYVVEVTGKELKNYMEWSASTYNQWKPGDLSISFDPEKPGYLYDMFEGVDYKIDLSQPVGQRIKDVIYKGKPLSDDERLNLAVNNYRYSSALKTDKLVAAKKHWESPVSIRDYLVKYISEQKNLSPEVSNNWEIIGIDLNSPQRQKLIDEVNSGKREVPYNAALRAE